MKVRYIGGYEGYSPVARRLLKPGDVFVVQQDVGVKLISSAQFEEVKPPPKPKVKEKEVKDNG